MHALRVLEGYRGRCVQCDGHEAYDKLAKTVRPAGPWSLVHCRPHVRRRFVKRQEKDGSPIVGEALRRIAGHEVGAENRALLASLIANCRMCDVDRVSCLSDALRALLDNHPGSRIDDLMPWNCAVARR
ncbi:IS66 family transposase [Frigidibacter sp. ROC022]|uniref:IS66 family transposase n=1 Tax=Frigidibacter sp. ROC022 TaxID=2971796 RepID=UPI00215ACAE1|nr:transposase [Frigidibacter sp. ROC022]